MPEKYQIHTHPEAPRFRIEGKLGIVDWREDCASCQNCVKKGSVYDIYQEETTALHEERGYLDYIYKCKGCLTCVQNCTKNILTRVVNTEYERLGDDYYNPDIILSTWFQAETGSIPVSGCGYGGPFSGPGFDSMWTDMSEIVRPTRDGIHGREYINTSVDIGRKLNHLSFNDGELDVSSPPIISTPLPLMFAELPSNWLRGSVPGILADVAGNLGLFSIVREHEIGDLEPSMVKTVIPLLSDGGSGDRFADSPMVIVLDGPDVLDSVSNLKKAKAERIVAVRVMASPSVAARVVELVDAGVEVVNLVHDRCGREDSPDSPRHVRDVVRDVHGALLKAGTRDEMTLISSGGIALPEHMAKAVICGADLVTIDIPLLIAMECRLCGECEHGNPCSIRLEETGKEYGVQRVTNLMGTWHNQLLELMGAMGIREARRLRGETGRCMFVEDLEEQAFGRIFGQRKTDYAI